MTSRSLLVLALLLTGCGGGGGGGSAAGAGTGPLGGATGQPGAGPMLESATLLDHDRDGAASAGDEIVLWFDQDVDASGLTIADLDLLSSTDSLGAGATVAPRPPREAVLRLGVGATLALYETYIPGPTSGASPAAISIDVARNPGAVRGASGAAARAGRPVPVLVERAARRKYQGGQSRGFYTAYLGEMHAHTTFSDGTGGEPAAAFDMARFQGGCDWYMVSDHIELMVPFLSWRWPEARRQADARNVEGTFVTFVGYEWSYGFANVIGGVMYQHCNIMSTEVIDFFGSTSLSGLYRNVQALSDDAIGKFNHPAQRSKNAGAFTITFDNWDDYRLDPEAEKHFAVVRCMEGSNDDAAGYIPLLDHGWHVAPGYGEDNHSGDWGLSRKKMGVYASFLTRDGIKEGIRERRTFTTSDRDAWVRLVARDEPADLWMGSTVAGPGPVELNIQGADPTDGIDRVELVTLGGAIEDSFPVAGGLSFDWTIVVDPPGDAYYYARVVEQDGNRIFSAPIFVDR